MWAAMLRSHDQKIASATKNILALAQCCIHAAMHVNSLKQLPHPLLQHKALLSAPLKVILLTQLQM